jgi:hypothetical protein
LSVHSSLACSISFVCLWFLCLLGLH